MLVFKGIKISKDLLTQLGLHKIFFFVWKRSHWL